MRWLIGLLLAFIRGVFGLRGAAGAVPISTTPPPAGSVSLPPSVPANTPPRIRWTMPPGPASGIPVPLRFTLEDDDSDPVRIEVDYSLDGGATFLPATEDTHVQTDGSVALASSPAGIDHVFAWDARHDVIASSVTGVLLRIKTFDVNPGAEVTSPPIDVDARVIAMPSLPTITPFNPYMVGANVPIRFVVSDRDSQPVGVEVKYRVGAGPWKPASPSIASDNLDLVPAPDIEADYRFIWSAESDLPQQSGHVDLQFRAFKGNVAGRATEITAISFDTTIVTAQPAFIPPPPVGTPTITILTTNPLPAISGQRLPEVLRVEVKDGNGQPIPGVRVSFTRTPSSVPFDIEAGPDLWEVTNAAGRAAVWVRVAPGAVGAGEVAIDLPGFPGARKRLAFTAVAPTIFCPTPGFLTAPLIYGHAYQLDVGYGDPSQTAWQADPARPVILKVEAVNASVSHALMHFPPAIGFFAGQQTLTLVPLLDATATGTIRISDVADPAVFVEFPFSVISHTVSRRVSLSMRATLPMRLEPVAGVPSTPQVGYPGLTLKQTFSVQLTDGTATPYDAQATNNITGCTVTPIPAVLPIEYVASSGELSTSATVAGTGTSRLQTTVGTPVLFTPKGDGPWTITAFVSDQVIDPHAVRIVYNVGGQPRCDRENAIFVNADFTFCVQRPEMVMLMPVTPPPPPAPYLPFTSVRAGDAGVLRVLGLSEFRPGGQPDRTDITTLFDGGRPLPAYTGYAHPFDQQITLTAIANNTGLQSSVINFMQGDPQAVPAGRHAVIPGAWVRIHSGAIDQVFPTPVRPYRRFTTVAGESLEENPAGHSPGAGALNSVLLHNGEFVYQAGGMSLVDRPLPMSISRTYRSHVRTDGPLGPGWDLEHFGSLDVSRDHGVRWFTGLGRTIDFPWLEAPPGVFMQAQTHLPITADQSAFELTDPQGNTIHFNVDGSIRFRTDLRNNRVRYEYNAAGQLTRVRGVWDNGLAFTYWKPGDPVHPDTYGKLREIADFLGRQITFDYYGAGSTDGLPGWLMIVHQPDPAAGETLVDGHPVTGFRNPESYVYQVNLQDRLDAKLVKILDSRVNANVRIENRYDPERRVIEQVADGRGAYTFTYTPNRRQTVFRDRRQRATTFNFPNSPFADASAPDAVIMQRDPALHPNAPDLTTTLTHTRAGLRAAIAHASGVIEEFWYDEHAPSPLSRGNLLRHRARPAAGGPGRVIGYEYDSRFNLVSRVAGPRGFAPGENVEAYTTAYTYNADGLLTHVVAPRTLHAVIQPVGSRRRVLWIDDNPSHSYAYNHFGLLTEHIDEQGVVTEYHYRPVTDPYGQSATVGATGVTGPSSPDEGGLLAFRHRDTRVTSDRRTYLPQVTLATTTHSYLYNFMGDCVVVIDPMKRMTFTHRNALHQIISVNDDGPGATRPVRTQMYDEWGNLAQIEISEPATPHRAMGVRTEQTFFNRTASRWEHLSTFVPTGPAPVGLPNPPWGALEVLELDAEDLPVAYSDAEAQAASAISLAFNCDERGLVADIRNGGSAALATRVHSTAAGTVDDVTFPGNRTLTGLTTPLGESSGVVATDGVRHELVRDSAGRVAREITSAPPAGTPPRKPVLGFSEMKRDEWGRARRTHTGLFLPTDLSTAAPPQAAEYFDHGGLTWPPDVGVTRLADGSWGPGDGRVTNDTLYSVTGQTVREVDDHRGVSWTRYDAHGHPIEWCDCRDEVAPYENITTAAYDPVSREIDQVFTVHSSDRSSPRVQTLISRDQMDGFGRLVRTLDGAGNAIEYEYNHRDQLIAMYDAVGRDSTTEIYNSEPVNERGNLTTYEYHEAGQLYRIDIALTRGGTGGNPAEVNPYNPLATVTVEYLYDRAGRFVAHVDWANYSVIRSYDAMGRIWKIRYGLSAASPNSPVEHTTTFDAQGRIETTTDGNGTVIRLEYDALNRIAYRRVAMPLTLPGSQGLHSAYDDNGFLQLAADVTTGYRSEFTYDSHGQVLTANEGGRSVASEYVSTGWRAAVSYPSGGAVRFDYDLNGRLRGVDDRGVGITIHYLGDSLVDSWTCGGITSRYAYDKAARATAISISGLSRGLLTFDLSYDRAGRIVEKRRQIGAGPVEVRSWFYDSAGRLVHDRAQPMAGSPHAETDTYLWLDGDGVVRKRETTTTASVGGAPSAPTVVECEREERGRVIRRNTTTLQYDKNGNLLDDGTRQFVYDAFDRLIETRRGAVSVVRYEYDAMHRLVKRVTTAATQEYVYDGSNLIEIRTGARTDRFVYADAAPELLLAEIAGQRYLVIASPEGSVDSLVDAHGDIVESYEYTAAGEVTRLSAARQALAGSPLCPFLHKQRLYDEEAGLFYYNVRWYSPELGVFLSPDPAGISESTNAYALCKGDPINRADPSGMLTEEFDLPSWEDVSSTFSLRNFSLWQGVKGGAGAIKAVGIGLWQLGLTAFDAGTHLGNVVNSIAWGPGCYRIRSFSALGQAWDASDGPFDFGWRVGKGIITTPLRMIEAGANGNAVGFGEEAMNLYLIGRPQWAVTRIGRGLNIFIGRVLPRIGRFGRLARTAIRSAQVLQAKYQAYLCLAMNWRRPDRIGKVKFKYGEGVGGGDTPGRFSPEAGDFGEVLIYESAFDPPPNPFDNLPEGFLERLEAENKGITQAMQEQGVNARGAAIHEAFHAYQHAKFPGWYNLAADAPGHLRYTEASTAGMLEKGAWNFQFIEGRPAPGWALGLKVTPYYQHQQRGR